MTLHIIADDLTGACDTGAAFAQRGLSTAVVMGDNTVIHPAPQVLVQTTESRYLPPQDAMRAVAHAAQLIAPADAWVYKKIDSTLRGNPSVELAALLDALDERRALAAPAFPAQGRTVVHGVLHVRGVPLQQTAFAAEGVTGDVRAALEQPQRPARNLTIADVRASADHLRKMLAQPQLFIADAETDGDLAALVRGAASAGVRVLCGSAGLASALAAYLDPTPAHISTPPRMQGAVLAVAGSRNPVTARQVLRARQTGISVIQPPAEFFVADGHSAVAATAQTVIAQLTAHGHALLSTCDLPESALGRQAIAERLAAVVALVAQQVALGGLVLTGGDVAAATCAALGAHLLWLDGEAQPGIALGHVMLGDGRRLSVVTKAGGFGDDDALLSAISNP